MNIVSVWFLPCRLYQALVLLICCLLSSHQAGFSWSQLNCQVFKECWEGSSVPKVLQLLIRYLSWIEFMDTIHLALDLTIIACMLAFSGFLCSAEFTIPNLASFWPTFHLTVTYFHGVTIMSSSSDQGFQKKDLFCMGCLFNLVWERAPLCVGPLFLLQSGQLLTRMHLTDWLRQILSAAPITGNFSSHSFCISAPTLAAHSGVPDNLIQGLRHWTSNAYQLYISTPSEALAGLSSKLAH